MAIDSKAKRFSMLNFGEDCALLPDPDGSFDQADRQHFLGLYSGILASAPDVITGIRYVRAAGGDDAEDGTTFAKGWATLGYAEGKTYSPGAVLYGDGAFAESWAFAWSGTDADSPITLADYGNGTFQVNGGIDFGGQDYCTVADVTVDGATKGVYANGCVGIRWENGTVQNCTEWGLQWLDVTEGVIGGEEGPIVTDIDGDGSSTGDGIYLGNDCVDCTISRPQLSGTFARQGIAFTSGSGLVIEYPEYTGSALNGIDIEANSGKTISDVIIRYGLIAPTAGDGVQISGGAGSTSGVLSHHNRIRKALGDSEQYDKGLQVANASDVISYADVIHGFEYNCYVNGTGELTAYNGTWAESQRNCLRILNTGNVTLRNTLLHASTDGAGSSMIYRAATATLDSDCNLFYTEDTGPLYFFDGSAPWLTFAGWQGEGHDEHSQWADPLFLDQANGKYSLAAGSPTDRRGENLGADYQAGLRHNASWPDNVLTHDWPTTGPWGIGAYPLLFGTSQVEEGEIYSDGAAAGFLWSDGQEEGELFTATAAAGEVVAG